VSDSATPADTGCAHRSTWVWPVPRSGALTTRTGVSLSGGSCRYRWLVGSFDVALASPSELTTALSRQEVSVRELVEESLAAIAALDPKIHAFTCVLAESALHQADEAQARLDAGEQRPFLAITVAVKAEVDLAGTVTSYGTSAQVTPARADSHPVARLRQGGAVLIGKTALPELAQWGHMTDTVAWGTTRNPWDPAHSSGGSSGGSAAAVAAGDGAGRDGIGWWRVDRGACGDVRPVRPQAPTWPSLAVAGC